MRTRPIFEKMTAWCREAQHDQNWVALDGKTVTAWFPEAQHDQNRVCVIWKNLGFAEGFSPD